MNNNVNLDLTRIPKELKFIMKIIKNDSPKQLQKFIVENKDINWELFLELTIHHRLFPLLLAKFKKMDVDLVPKDILLRLSQLYKTNTFRMLHLTREMGTLCKVFKENQIRSMVLKGPVLAESLYGDLSLRTSSDLDILIPIAELNKTENLLINMGFEKEDEIDPNMNDWKWRLHHFTYYHAQKGVKCEIHWKLHPGLVKEPSFDELWGRKQISNVTSNPIYFLGREDLFLFLVTHGARHGWSRLRWLIDIERLLRKDINWEFLYTQFNRYKQLPLAGQAIILSTQLLGTKVTKEMNSLIVGTRPKKLAQKAVFYFERMTNLHTLPLPKEIKRHYILYLFSLMSNHQKLLTTFSLLYPSTADAKTLPLPKNLYFLYYLLHPFLWVWRKTGKRVFSYSKKVVE